MYNPIQIACDTFLTLDNTKKNQRIKNLFICAQNGIKKLIETYRNCSIISLCLNYYYVIISNYVEGKYNETIFLKDTMTCLYTKELVEKLNQQANQYESKLNELQNKYNFVHNRNNEITKKFLEYEKITKNNLMDHEGHSFYRCLIVNPPINIDAKLSNDLK
jgi:hypothetical protein